MRLDNAQIKLMEEQLMREITSRRDAWFGIKRYVARNGAEIVVYPPGAGKDPVTLEDLRRDK